MTLRQKSLLVVGVTFIGLMIVLYAASRVILLGSFAKLEDQETRASVQRVIDTLSDDIAQLNSIAGDWAPWDDTYAFVEDANEDYIKSNMTDDTFINLRLNLMVFVDLSGRVVYSKAFDLYNKNEIEVPQGLQAHLIGTPSKTLLGHADAQSSVSGVLLLSGSESPLLIASRPILKSGGYGPIRGTLIVGRFADSVEIGQLARLTHLSLTMQRYGDAQVPLSKKTPIVVQPLNDQIIAGYALVNDIYGNPALVFRMDIPRGIYHQGQTSLNYLLLSLWVAGVVFIVMTVFLWDQLALSRLARLSAGVSRIGASSDLSARVEVAGKDELSSVANAINRMLEALQRSEEALRESEERFRRLAENAVDVITRLEFMPQPHLTYISPAIKTLSGLSPEEFYADPDLGFKLVHPEDRPMLEALDRGEVSPGMPITLRWVRKDETIVWVEQRNVPIYDEAGNLVAVEGIARDITQRKQVEDALRTSEERFRRQATELRVLYELSLRLNAQLETSELLHMILEQAIGLLEARAGGLYTYDPQHDELSLSLSVSYLEELALMKFKPGEGLVGQAFQNRCVIPVENYSTWPGRMALPEANRLQAMLAVPLSGMEGILGVLEIVGGERPFDDHDIRLAELFATQAAVALEKARLHAEVERRARELAALNKASQAILSTLDLQAVLKLVITEVKGLLDAEGASVLLLDPVTEELVFAALASPASDRLESTRIPASSGIAGWVIQEKQAVLISDAYHDPRFYNQVDEMSGMTTRSLMAVPLMSKGTANGVIEAINKTKSDFDQHDLELLKAMAGSTAIAIENARLFGQVRKTADRLQVLSRRLVEVQEIERSRIARELHDEAGQALTSLAVNLRLLEQEADRSEAVRARVAELKQMTSSVLEGLHRLAIDLRPASLDHLGLVAALRQYIQSFGQQYGLTMQFEPVRLDDERMPPDAEIALYRIVQEALTNVARHAKANRADVILERRGDRVVVMIWDNGIGFEPDVALQSDRLGLIGMRERAEMLGGTFDVESEIGKGTTIIVEVPYANAYSDR